MSTLKNISAILTEPVHGPVAWTGDEMAKSAEWLYRIPERALREIEAALARIDSLGLSLKEMRKEHFDVPTLAADLPAIAAEVESGRGFVQMKGLPVDHYDAREAEIVYWGIGLHVGTALSQNARGDLLGHVRDEGLDISDTNVRGYQTNAKQSFHTDIGGDVVALMCLHGAKSGGRSRIVSSMSIYNELLSACPWYIGLLYNGFDIDWRGEQPDGSPATYREPIYAYFDGKLSCRFMPRFIKSAQSKSGRPLSLAENEALEVMERLAERLCFEIPFDRGDLQFINNYVVLHGRTGYEDFQEPHRRRHLLRLWLKVAGSRTLPPEYGEGRARLGVPQKTHAQAEVTQW